MEDYHLSKFDVKITGNGEKNLVFAHGFGSDQTAWRYQIKVLAPQYRIISFNYLGCGKLKSSDYNPLHYNSMHAYKEDLLAIYRFLGLRQTIFVGHSASAMIGMLASLEQPDFFTKMVLVCASPRYLNDTDYIGGFEESDLENLFRTMSEDYLSWANGFAPIVMRNHQKPSLGAEFAYSLSSMRPDIAQSVARVLFRSDLREKLPFLKHPVLILQAKNDIAVPLQVGQYLATHIPNSQLRFLHAEGHLPHLSSPNEVTDAIVKFIE